MCVRIGLPGALTEEGAGPTERSAGLPSHQGLPKPWLVFLLRLWGWGPGLCRDQADRSLLPILRAVPEPSAPRFPLCPHESSRCPYPSGIRSTPALGRTASVSSRSSYSWSSRLSPASDRAFTVGSWSRDTHGSSAHLGSWADGGSRLNVPILPAGGPAARGPEHRLLLTLDSHPAGAGFMPASPRLISGLPFLETLSHLGGGQEWRPVPAAPSSSPPRNICALSKGPWCPGSERARGPNPSAHCVSDSLHGRGRD